MDLPAARHSTIMKTSVTCATEFDRGGKIEMTLVALVNADARVLVNAGGEQFTMIIDGVARVWCIHFTVPMAAASCGTARNSTGITDESFPICVCSLESDTYPRYSDLTPRGRQIKIYGVQPTALWPRTVSTDS